MVQAVTPISQLFARPRDPDAIVAYRGNEPIRWRRLAGDVALLESRLQTTNGSQWLVADSDAYAIAVGTLAVLQTGGKAILPANLQRGHLTDIATNADGILSSTDIVPGTIDMFAPRSVGEIPDLHTVDPERAEIILHTSGTTGDPVAAYKPLRCLEAEIDDLTEVFAPERGRSVIATVPPYHIYGLLFRVLWPLATGQVLSGGLIQFPEQLSAAAQKHRGCTLVSSPAFLKRALPVLDLEQLNEFIGPVYSSGGPLPPPVAARYNKILSIPVVEVYGSTETGGIAYRSVLDPTAETPWHPLPNVAVAVDDAQEVLKVRSPFLPDDNWFLTGDRVRLHSEGQFTLSGRTDRIVKLEEQRISLTEIERRLTECEFVDTARVAPLPSRPDERQILGAVIEPSAIGWDRLAAKGRRSLRVLLTEKLKPYLTALALPRKWRFVTQIPEDARGKTSDAALVALFESRQGRKVEPIILRQDTAKNHLAIHMRLQSDLFYFDGHFDEAAILPGVVQVDWAIKFAAAQFAISGHFQRVEALKFFKILQDEDEVTLDLHYNEENGRLAFEYSSAETKFSSGRIIFSAVS